MKQGRKMSYSSLRREKKREREIKFHKAQAGYNDICWREEAFNLFHRDNAAAYVKNLNLPPSLPSTPHRPTNDFPLIFNED